MAFVFLGAAAYAQVPTSKSCPWNLSLAQQPHKRQSTLLGSQIATWKVLDSERERQVSAWMGTDWPWQNSNALADYGLRS